ncbi:MAG: hypothetical protein WBV94_24535 [Blastocatellia bacterium]
MRTANFCSNCGEQLKVNRASIFRAHAYCPRCARTFRSDRLVLTLSYVVCLIIGYAFGRYSMPQKPLYLLGTPINPITNRNERGETAARNKSGLPSASSTDQVIKACGAPTKSGRPCRRKVVGGGYCWQHRDKYGSKKPTASGPLH